MRVEDQNKQCILVVYIGESTNPKKKQVILNRKANTYYICVNVIDPRGLNYHESQRLNLINYNFNNQCYELGPVDLIHSEWNVPVKHYNNFIVKVINIVDIPPIPSVLLGADGLQLYRDVNKYSFINIVRKLGSTNISDVIHYMEFWQTYNDVLCHSIRRCSIDNGDHDTVDYKYTFD